MWIDPQDGLSARIPEVDSRWVMFDSAMVLIQLGIDIVDIVLRWKYECLET
jgi:hypothetical protein